jgi:uncharacterized DUF497 family protein
MLIVSMPGMPAATIARNTQITMGVIEGRVFVVAYTPRRPVVRLISARKANARET